MRRISSTVARQEVLGSVVEVGDQTVKQLRVSLQPLNRPGKGGGGRSWPAARMVINSSAISARVIGEPSS